MPGLFDWISSGISTAVQPITNWLGDTRPPDVSRPRAQSFDPTQAIDAVSGQYNRLSFPHDLPKYYITFGFEEYERPSQFKGLTRSGIQDYISLPLPNNMKDLNHIEYKAEEGHILAEALSMLGDELASANKTGGVDGLISGLTGIAKDGGYGASGWAVKKALNAARAAGSLVGEDRLVDGALQFAGLADNPFMTVALKGPSFKQHHFSWRFAPKSPAESESLKKIINTFKKVAYPELLSIGAGGFFKYPNIVWPKFQPDSVIGYTYAFKPCVVTNININYTPNDRPGFYPTTAPVEALVEIQLLEIELWRGGEDDSFLNPETGTLQKPTIPGDFQDVESPPGTGSSRNLGTI